MRAPVSPVLAGAASLACSWCCGGRLPPAPRPRRRHAEIKLGCALRQPEPAAGPRPEPGRSSAAGPPPRWRRDPPTGVWRSVDAGRAACWPRARRRAAPLRGLRDPERAHLHYVVVGVGRTGRAWRGATSVRSASAGRPRPSGSTACSSSTARAAACCAAGRMRSVRAERYVLWRSVDGAAREAIYRAGRGRPPLVLRQRRRSPASPSATRSSRSPRTAGSSARRARPGLIPSWTLAAR